MSDFGEMALRMGFLTHRELYEWERQRKERPDPPPLTPEEQAEKDELMEKFKDPKLTINQMRELIGLPSLGLRGDRRLNETYPRD